MHWQPPLPLSGAHRGARAGCREPFAVFNGQRWASVCPNSELTYRGRDYLSQNSLTAFRYDRPTVLASEPPLAATFGGIVAYEDFLLNTYLWLLLGILFRLPSIQLSAQLAANALAAQSQRGWIR